MAKPKPPPYPRGGPRKQRMFDAPLVIAYGVGVDSTAVLVELARRKVRPDLILFADTGSEKLETIEYLDRIQRWLKAQDFPPVVRVAYPGPLAQQFKPDDPRLARSLMTPTGVWPEGTPEVALPKYTSLLQECLVKPMLPSLAYRFRKGCSLKWKRDPQNRYVAKFWSEGPATWNAGKRLVKMIGYDAGPKDARRSAIKDDDRYTYWYPLREWGWDRDQCKAEIARADLEVPLKSACFFCPSAKEHEITWLVRNHPMLADLIIAMERRAAPTLTSIVGLWGDRTMTEWIEYVRLRDAKGTGKNLPCYSEEDGEELGCGCVPA